jgi:hypothetical protein
MFEKQEGYMGLKRYFLLIALCFVPTSLFSNQLYFPQVCFGVGATTTIVLMNTGMTNVSSDFRIYAQSGGLHRSIPTTVPGGGSTRVSIADPAPSTICSWGLFDARTETVKGIATIDIRSGTGALVNRAGLFGVEPANDFSFPVDVTVASNTGFAVANVSPNSVTLNLQLLSESGNGSPSATGAFARSITLGAGQQIAELVTAIWPQLAAAEFRGTLLIWASPGQLNPLVLTAVNVKEGLLSAVPAISGFANACLGCWDY